MANPLHTIFLEINELQNAAKGYVAALEKRTTHLGERPGELISEAITRNHEQMTAELGKLIKHCEEIQLKFEEKLLPADNMMIMKIDIKGEKIDGYLGQIAMAIDHFKENESAINNKP